MTHASSTAAPASSILSRRLIKPLIIIFGLSLLVRGLMLYYRLEILGMEFNYLVSSDVRGWLQMARHIYKNGTFTHWLMGARPPFYPLVVAGVYSLGGNKNLNAALLQIVFGSITPVLGFLTARRLFPSSKLFKNPSKAALIAGVVMALDLASISVSATLLAEPLFNLLFTATILSLVVYIQERRPRELALSAFFLGLSMLTRPTTIYFWLAIPFIVVPLMKDWWKPVLTLIGVGLLVYFGWSFRNYTVLGIYTYSTQANFTLLFLRASSAEHLATGETIDDIYVDYVHEIYTRLDDPRADQPISEDAFWDFHVAESPEVYGVMGDLAREKLIRYWFWAVLGSGVGLVRMLSLTLAYPQWVYPIEGVYHLFLYSLMFAGAWQAYRRKAWTLLLTMGIPILYVVGLTLASQTSAMDTRMRTPISVPIIVLAVYGGMWLHSVWNARRGGAEDKISEAPPRR